MTELLSKLSLKGSSKVVADYFQFAIYNILFQRGIYPAEEFTTVKKYDLPMLVSADDDVRSYVDKIMRQVKKWIYGGKLTKLVVVILLYYITIVFIGYALEYDYLYHNRSSDNCQYFRSYIRRDVEGKECLGNKWHKDNSSQIKCILVLRFLSRNLL